jgi:DNA gyrase subunit A
MTIEDNNSIPVEASKVLPMSIETEMQRAYLDYAMSVIVSRALPDCRDGLKPVHRRILYAMHTAGNHHNKPYRKSARIVGEVMGKFHPHGDAAIYGSLARMAQDFSLLAPLVDGQGNFGSIDGDEPAQMRYTEARLAKLADIGLLVDIDKDTVDFQNNYDSSEIEPRVLPVRFPNLLINGANGIAVGMATNIPPHNMGEIIDACCAYIDNENITMDEMLEYIPGPDFPTGGEILGVDRTKTALSTGRGSIIIRGKTAIEGDNRRTIVITEVPYQVNKAELVKSIEILANEKVIEGISEIRDESNKLGIRVVLELKKDSEAEVILNKLYKQTQLQTFFGVNMVALKDGQPLVTNVYEMIINFLKFREEVIRNRTKFLLQKAQDKAHTLVGLLIAVENIEEIIPLVRGAKDTHTAKENLISRKWNATSVVDVLDVIKDDRNEIEGSYTMFSESQVKSILEMRLQRLTALEHHKIHDELISLAEDIKEYVSLLESRPKLLQLMREELVEIKDNFATPRRTTISQHLLEMTDMDLIQCEDIVLTITRDGYIKKTALSNYKGQRRSGRGKTTMNIGDDDCVTQMIITTTHHHILFFTDAGKVYRMIGYQIPLGSLQSKGRAIVNLISVGENEKVTNVIAMPYVKFERNKKNVEAEELVTDVVVDDLNNEEDVENGLVQETLVDDTSEYMVFATAKGNIRRNSVKDFYNIPANGKIAIGLEDGDKLVGVNICKGDDHVFLATKMGKAIRFPIAKVRVFKGRTSTGVRGIRLAANDDAVVALAILNGLVVSNEEKEAYLKIGLEKRLQIAEKSLDNMEAARATAEKAISKLEDQVLSADTVINLAQREQFMLTVTSYGYGKCSSSYSYRITGRGGQGVINASLKKYTGKVIASFPVTKSDDVVVVTQHAITIRISADEIRISGRSSSGVRLINLNEGDIISSVSRVIDGKNSEEEVEE